MIPVIAQETVIAFLMWACGVLGVGLISTLAFVALGVMRRLDDMKVSNESQFAAFGKQLATVHDLVMVDIHKHDVRIVRLEEWRKSVDKTPAVGD